MQSEPKYLTIKKAIQKKIETNAYPLGSRIPSESELREIYNVSRHTVRSAINNLVNEGYVVKQQGSGTFVSDYYQSKMINQEVSSPKKIGVISTYIADYIFPSIIRGIEEKLSQHGYSLLLYSTKNDVEIERLALKTMIEQEVDGLIIEPTKSNLMNPNLDYYLKLVEKQIPLVMINASYDELDLPVIAMEDTVSGKVATEYLIEKGHTNIGMITKCDDIQGKNRMKGYLKALYDAQLSFSSDFILQYDTEERPHIAKVIKSMLQKENLPTAFVSYNDEIALILIEEMNKLDLKCPEDISIVSHDNSFISDTLSGVKVTSINHSKEALGKKAAEVIIESIEEDAPIRSYYFKPELVIRDSVIELEDIDVSFLSDT